jgi:hydrogenase maturation protease
LRITILGLGNILQQDEGFGVWFLRHLEESFRFPAGVRLVDGGTLGYGLLDTISACDRLYVIDIIKSDDPAGTLYRFSHQEMELRLPEPTSAHEVEFFDVLGMAEMMGELPETIFLCIAPETYGGELATGMTPVMYRAFPAMERLLLKELAAIGIEPAKISASQPPPPDA